MSSKFHRVGFGDMKVLDTLYEESEQEDGSDIDSEKDYGTSVAEILLEFRDDHKARDITERYLDTCIDERSRSSSRPSFLPPRFWERYVIEGRKVINPHGEEREEEESFIVRRRGEGGLCVVKVLSGYEEHDDRGQIIRGYGEKVDKELAILESIIDGQDLPESDEAYFQERESALEDQQEVDFTPFHEAGDGSVFVQKIFDIFMSDIDDKVYIIQSYYERSLKDAMLSAWFRLPSHEDGVTQNIAGLDPDGTFIGSQNTCARPYHDTLHCLKILACEITLGLLFLHKRGIVHHNLEPGNVLVTSSGHIEIKQFEGASLLPKLQIVSSAISDLVSIDLGSSNTVSAQEKTFGSLTLAEDRAITTNPRYAAPELSNRDVSGSIVYDERVDWWCLGVLLRELAYDAVDFVASHSTSEEEDNFRGFVHELLTCDPDQRLTGFAVKEHAFLDFTEKSWLEILALRHRPCPSSAEIIVEDSCRTSMAQPAVSPKTSRDTTPTQYAESVSSVEEYPNSQTQPFPATASLWINDPLPLKCQSESDAEEALVDNGFNDSGLALQEPPVLLVEGTPWQGTDTDTYNDPPISMEKESDPSHSEIMELPDTPQVEERQHEQYGTDVLRMRSSAREGVKSQMHPERRLTMDEMVAVSLLQAREEDGMDIIGYGEDRVRVKPSGKARFIANATKQAIMIVKHHIYETIRCR